MSADRDDEIARDRAGRDALEVLCARHRCEWSLDLTAPRPVVTLHRKGGVIGSASGDTLADAVAAHAVILGDAPAPTTPDRGPRPKGAIYDCAPHPLLAGVAYSTKRAGLAADVVRDYIEAALIDGGGVAVRLWLTTDPRDCPADCMEG